MLALAQQMIAIWDEYRHQRNVFAYSFDDAILILQKQKQKDAMSQDIYPA